MAKRTWSTDTSNMNFSNAERDTVEKVINYTDSILYFNGKDYKVEDPCDTYYYTSKDLLMENMNYEYTELEKQGVFNEEEEEAPVQGELTDRYEEYLKRNISEYELRIELSRNRLIEQAQEFRAWVLNETSDAMLVADAEWRGKQLSKAEEEHTELNGELRKAKIALEIYREMKGKERKIANDLIEEVYRETIADLEGGR